MAARLNVRLFDYPWWVYGEHGLCCRWASIPCRLFAIPLNACGIQKADGTAIVMGHILSRKSVHQDTWTKIVAEVTAHDISKV